MKRGHSPDFRIVNDPSWACFLVLPSVTATLSPEVKNLPPDALLYVYAKNPDCERTDLFPLCLTLPVKSTLAAV